MCAHRHMHYQLVFTITIWSLVASERSSLCFVTRACRQQKRRSCQTRLPAQSKVSSLQYCRWQQLQQPTSRLHDQQPTNSFSMTTHSQKPFSLSLSEFLQQSRLDSSNQYVIGNQAGDADSIISALTLAYIDSMAGYGSRLSNSNLTTVPIVSVSQQDFKFRQETVRLLELAGVTNGETSLHFMDQVLQSNIGNSEDEATVILVDHNRLDKTLEERNWRVAEISDHHLDEGLYLDTVIGESRNVAYHDNNALVGSTCTLVTERLISFREQLPPPYPADLALTLLGVIVLDTVNMSPDAGKGTKRDQQAIDTLLEQTDWTTLPKSQPNALQRILVPTNGSVRPDLTQLFELLQSAKFDQTFWKSLSSLDALRLDYKNFKSTSDNPRVFGVSTVLMPMDDFLSKADLWRTIPSYMEEQSIVVLGVMTASATLDGNLERELLLCSFQQNQEILDSLSSFLMKHSSLSLDEVPLHQSDFQNMKHSLVVQIRRFRQGNSKASRKQVVPFILQAFASERL